MKLAVCRSCEKKLKVPDAIADKGSFKCPACGELVRLASRERNAEDEFIDEELFEIDLAPRRSAKSSQGGRRLSGRSEESSTSSFGVMIGLGGLVIGIGLFAALMLVGRRNANEQIAQQPVVQPAASVPQNIAPIPNGPQPASGENEDTLPTQGKRNSSPVDLQPVQSATNQAANLASAVPATPATPVLNPAPQNPAPAAPAQPAPTTPAVAAKPTGALRYQWQPNREYPYKFSIEANFGDVIERTEGVCIYRVAPTPAGPIIEFKRQGSGTAFVVSADGFLVTCAHVVDGAKSIEVQLGGKKYPATVVSTDAARDVAVIRIDAQNLTPVALTDSSSVQLGQAVRALGYPLADVLGENVKVTIGSVSGLNQEGNSRVFQIDAAINPGNSGGPIVNEAGEVIGVACAKLAGPTVSTVGFARPINDVKALLQKAGAKIVAGTSEQKLDGPTLASRVSPSVALVKVVAGASGNRTTLAYEANFSTTQRDAPGKRTFRVSIPGSARGRGTITLDEFGEIVQLTGEEQLPFCMGPVGLVALAPLNPSGQTTWGRSEQTSVTRIEQDPNDPLARLRARGIRRPPFGPFANQPKETVFPAQESTTFTLGQEAADVLSIKKSYELKTLDNVNSPYLMLKGEGDWRFHRKDAMPHSAEMKLELTRNFENGTIRVPFQMQFQYTDPQVIAGERQQAEERQAANVRQQSQKAAEELDKLAGPKKAKLLRRFTGIGTILVQAVQLTPDGQRALVSTHEGPVLVFDAKQVEPIARLEGLKQNVQFLNVSSDGKLVCGGTLTEACVWNLDTQKIVLQPKIDRFAPACMTFSSDNQRVYFGFGFLRLQGWDLASGKLLNEWQPKSGNSKAVMLTPDGQTLIATDGQQLFHYDPSTGNLQKTEPLAPGGGSYYHARLTAEGGRGVFVKSLSSLDVISLDNPTKATNIAVRPSPNSSFAISANGKRVVVADSSNKQVVVWDVDKNQVIDQWPVDTIAAQAVAISADGKFVLTSGYHKVLQLWEMTE